MDIRVRFALRGLKISETVHIEAFYFHKEEWFTSNNTEKAQCKTDVDFKTPIDFKYYFEQQQQICFILTNEGHDFIGCFNGCLAELVAGGSRFDVPLSSIIPQKLVHKYNEIDEKVTGRLIMNVEALGQRDNYTISIEVQWLSAPTMWSDAHFQLKRPDGSCLYQSAKLNEKHLSWPEFQITHDFNGSLLSFELTVTSMKIKKKTYPDCQIELNGSGRYEIPNVATVIVNKMEVSPTFYRALSDRSWNINFAVGIDFTFSNGSPKDPTSLHAILAPGFMNPYENVIYHISNIIRYFNPFGFIPAYGFGASLPGMTGMTSSKCFCLQSFNNLTSPETTIQPLPSVDHLFAAYKNAIAKVKLSGPTCLAPLISHVCHLVKTLTFKSYTILTILTDGQVEDYDLTTNAIIDASVLPISIIIIGIGVADFTKMQKLNTTGQNLVAYNNAARHSQRDMVQFVQMSTFQGNYQNLCSQVLQKIPSQFMAYQTLIRNK